MILYGQFRYLTFTCELRKGKEEQVQEGMGGCAASTQHVWDLISTPAAAVEPQEQTAQCDSVSLWLEHTIHGALQHFSKQTQLAALSHSGNGY